MNNFINNQRRKILFLITQSETGGAQRFLVNLVKKLNKDRYEILFAAGPDGNWEIFEELAGHGVQTHKLKYARRNINPILDILAIYEIKKLVKKFRPDTFFLNSSKPSIWGPLAINLPPKIKHKPKIIYRIGGWSFNDPRSALGRWFWITLEKIFAGYKDIIIVNNRHDLEQAKELHIKPLEEVILIHNGIDLRDIELLPKDEAGKKLSLNDRGLIIGTIANFYPAKGLGSLLEAMTILNFKFKILNVKLVIIGDGEGRKELESQIKKYDIENNVVLTGRLPDAKKYLPAFDIFVLPSVKEGFPWSVLEAMAAKLPIVATRVGAVPEIIEDGKNGLLVEPGNPKQLAEAIKKLLDNEHLRQELGIQAHQTVLFKFDEDRMVKSIEKLL